MQSLCFIPTQTQIELIDDINTKRESDKSTFTFLSYLPRIRLSFPPNRQILKHFIFSFLPPPLFLKTFSSSVNLFFSFLLPHCPFTSCGFAPYLGRSSNVYLFQNLMLYFDAHMFTIHVGRDRGFFVCNYRHSVVSNTFQYEFQTRIFYLTFFHITSESFRLRLGQSQLN